MRRPLHARTSLDVGDREAVQAAVAAIEAEAGAIDILVNNAGGVRGQVGRPLEEISREPTGRRSSTSI